MPARSTPSQPRSSSRFVSWGFNQVVVKLALPDVGPIAQTGIGARCVIACALATRRRIFEIDGAEAAGALVARCSRPNS